MGLQWQGLVALQQCRNLAESYEKEQGTFSENRCLLDVFQTVTHLYLVQVGIDVWMPSLSQLLDTADFTFIYVS